MTIKKLFSPIVKWWRSLTTRIEPRFDIAAFREAYRWAVPLIILYELVSLTAYVVPAVASPVFLIVLGATAILALKRFDLAMLVLLTELFVGSQGGYMLTFGAEMGLEMSLRHALFLLLVAIWFAEMLASTFAGGVRRRAAWEWMRQMEKSKIFWPYVALVGMLLVGIIRGKLHGNAFNLIFFDVNRSLYLGLFPALVAAFLLPRMRERAAGVLAAAVTTAVLKALVVEFFFAHRVFYVAKILYVWIRDTRVGEITIMVADFYRVFFQSQIFILVSVFVAALLFAYAAKWRNRGALLAGAYVVWSMVSMLLSLSRSFWFGGAVATLILVALLVWGRARSAVWLRLVGLGLSSVLIAGCIIGVTYIFPWPNPSGDVSLTSIFGARAFSFNDDAAKSRWELLPKLNEAAMQHPLLGSGYGTTVTYATHDPRLLAANQTADYTTYAFEWGYHDIWLKIGLIGAGIYAWFLYSLLRPLARRLKATRTHLGGADMAFDGGEKHLSVITAGIFIGVLALLATNIFSPYLNHPLGIGVLMIMGALSASGFFEYHRKNDDTRKA